MKTAFRMISTTLVSTMIAACAGNALENDADDAVNAAETEQALDSSLMLHLKLNEGVGTEPINSGDSAVTAAFRSGGVYQWIPAGNANCIMGSCVHFDGSGYNVNGISTNLGLNGLLTTGASYPYARVTDTSMSYSAWVVLDAGQTSGRHQILSGDDGNEDWSLLYTTTLGQTNSRLTLFIGGTPVDSGYILVPGVRYHLAATFNTETRMAKVYLNGVEVPLPVAYMSPNVTSVNGIYVGENPGGWNEPMKGFIDDVRVYKRVLAPGELGTVACDDGDPWTTDVFVTNELTGAGECTHTQIGCLADSECDDSDPSTVDTCLDHVCQHVQLCGDGFCDVDESCPVDCGMPSPVAHWNFNDCTDGKVLMVPDVSGNGADGTLNGAAQCVQPPLGMDPVGDFQGGIDSVEICTTNCGVDRSFLHFQDQMTASAWVYPRAMTGFRTIVNQWYGMDSFTLGMVDGKYYFSVAFPGGQWGQHFMVETPATLNAWAHVAGVYTGDALAIYVNGTLRASVPTGTPGAALQQSTRPIVIGNHPSWNAFDGQIDEVRLYQDALTDAEVAFLFSNNP